MQSESIIQTQLTTTKSHAPVFIILTHTHIGSSKRLLYAHTYRLIYLTYTENNNNNIAPNIYVFNLRT